MNGNHKYKLEPYKGSKTRHICPNCHKKGQFTLYVDMDTGEPLADNVGLCNRAIKCGYHYSPKQYFLDNQHTGPHTSKNPERQARKKAVVPVQEKPISLIPFETLKRTLRSFDKNHFAVFLTNRLGLEMAEQVAGQYFLGTSGHWEGANVFWQIDMEGRIRTGKVMLYDPITGKRVKKPYPHINWVHKLAGYKDYNLDQCLFGEHLLKEHPFKPVAIVESEKTAMLCAVHCPDFLWLASGNLNNLSIKRIQCLKGKAVTLYPDAGAYQIWLNKARQLKDIANIQVSQLIENKATAEQLKKGYDMADFLTEPPQSSTRKASNDKLKRAKPKKDVNLHSDEIDSKDRFFMESEKIETVGKEIWPVDELVGFFKEAELPAGPINLSSSVTITDLGKFVETSLHTVKLHNGKSVYRPYYNRLEQLKNYLIKNDY
ncbi:DUF6965 family protein [Flagellimonas sp.]|uniref:DUF6965 family protein n=1 Tax=Flagellimonas sp. TaxID=2058762 RepID=UPI003B51866A